jgi:hypothetical protein
MKRSEARFRQRGGAGQGAAAKGEWDVGQSA